MVKPSTRMREALEQALRGPLRRTLDPQPGAPPWPAPAATLHALARHELVVYTVVRNRHGWPVQTWTITDAGRQALQPTTRRRSDRPRRLAHSLSPTGTLQAPYTTDPRRAMRHEPEPVWPPDEITPIAAVRHIEAKRQEHQRREARQLAQRTRQAVIYAQRQGLADELDALRAAVAAIDQHRRAA